MRTLLLIALLSPAPLLAADPRVGWRGDGTGRFADADPPVEWDAKGKGILWKTPLPSASNSGPVVVGDRVFTAAEPGTLLCYSTKDGRQLWASEITFYDTTPDDAEAADIIRRWKSAKTDTEKYAVRKDILRHDYFEMPPTMGYHFGFNMEYTFPTPTSDGERVYVAYGTGLVAAYTVDGKRTWARVLSKPRSSIGYTASPLLAGGRLLVPMGGELHALDPATGKTAWTAPHKDCYGSPVRVTVGDTEAVVMPKGNVYRATDGKKLATGAAVNYYQSATAEGDVVYSMRDDAFTDDKDGSAKMLAVKLITKDDGTLTVQKLWETAKPSGYGSPLSLDGVLYASRSKLGLSTFNAKSGAGLTTERVKTGGENYPSVAACGGHLYVPFQDGKVGVMKAGREPELVATNDLGLQDDQLVGGPFFAGNRLYLRTHKFLFCIGAN